MAIEKLNLEKAIGGLLTKQKELDTTENKYTAEHLRREAKRKKFNA